LSNRSTRALSSTKPGYHYQMLGSGDKDAEGQWKYNVANFTIF